MEFRAALAAEGAGLDEQTRAKLGEQFIDLLALAMSGEPDRQPADDRSVQRARLRSAQAYMEAHLSDPSLSLSAIARKNGISLRYLHQLFRLTDMSASEWLRLRRLQRCHDILSSPGQTTRSITGNRLFHGARQFVPFQQSLSRAIRAVAIRRQGRFRRLESSANDSKLRIKARLHFGP
jgi:transcriptional regulator GlxA family with amidase domain